MQKEELQGLIVARGKTQKDVANHLGMAEKTFSLKMQKGIFGSNEIDLMIDYLEIENPMWIFFDRIVTLQDTKRIKFIKHE